MSPSLSKLQNTKKYMYGIASSTADIATLLSNTGIVVAASITVILAGAVALVGLGFAWRHLTKRVTGKKF